ncbi:LacI family transcriptional regulator [Chitinophaga terrae (ex Kim and Jung 2007)]|uniref:LacI family DNA-binding transcriptional regulator n=1 Tax=Chitinophaga terrae (ex Kim and Jung 2007) TaxID=408074 RepID=UPI0027883EEB|nr:LacI family DNA-binding transcriptional regulator [Chitinophaga terrae (ex Kim and Jung 2007)]MDQ0107665.1 LacI family transcriptional regulator [Chitinophaga terrae (ex Kim and Jung 2007)]
MSKRSEKTIVDIAEELNLSVSTVSRALNDNPNISIRTKEKVKKMARKMGYRPNALAAGLRSSKSKTIGLIVPRISMFFPAAISTIIQNKLQEYGYNLIICQSNDSYEQEIALVNTLYSARVDGLVVSTTLYTTDFSHFDVFRDNNIPLVFFDRVPKDYGVKVIKGDDQLGGYLATSHLIERGCRDIVHISGPLSSNLYVERVAGYKKALKQHSLPVRKDRLFYQELSRDHAWQTCEKIFASKPYPDGIFASNDTTAITIMEYCRKINIRIPEDLKIVGYSNDPRTEIITPAISSVDQYPAMMGERVVAALMDMINATTPSTGFSQEIIPIQLIARESSAGQMKTKGKKK